VAGTPARGAEVSGFYPPVPVAAGANGAASFELAKTRYLPALRRRAFDGNYRQGSRY